jgi:hypothetical protein
VESVSHSLNHQFIYLTDIMFLAVILHHLLGNDDEESTQDEEAAPVVQKSRKRQSTISAGHNPGHKVTGRKPALASATDTIVSAGLPNVGISNHIPESPIADPMHTLDDTRAATTSQNDNPREATQGEGAASAIQKRQSATSTGHNPERKVTGQNPGTDIIASAGLANTGIGDHVPDSPITDPMHSLDDGRAATTSRNESPTLAGHNLGREVTGQKPGTDTIVSAGLANAGVGDHVPDSPITDPTDSLDDGPVTTTSRSDNTNVVNAGMDDSVPSHSEYLNAGFTNSLDCNWTAITAQNDYIHEEGSQVTDDNVLHTGMDDGIPSRIGTDSTISPDHNWITVAAQNSDSDVDINSRIAKKTHKDYVGLGAGIDDIGASSSHRG